MPCEFESMIYSLNQTYSRYLQIVLFRVSMIIHKINHVIRNEFKMRLYMYIYTLL